MEGLSVTYTLTVTNSGPGAAGNVIVTDEPACWSAIRLRNAFSRRLPGDVGHSDV